MINLFFPIISCAENVKDAASSIYDIVVPILVVLDLVFLLYVVFGSNENYKDYNTILLLSHGSIIAGIKAANYFEVSLAIPIIIIIVLAAYYFLCTSVLFVMCVTAFNTTMMLGLVVEDLFKENSFLLSLLSVSISTAAIVFGLLAFFRFKILEKLHNVFVLFLVICYLVRKIFDALLPGTLDSGIQGMSFYYITQVVVFAMLVFTIFIRDK